MDLLDMDVKKEDYSEQVSNTINETRSLIERGALNEALSILLTLEKNTRIANDNESTTRVLVEIVSVLKEAGRFDEMCKLIRLLCRKRSQSKHAMHSLIKEGFSYVESISSIGVRMNVIETLLAVSEGKIFAEIERARLTMMLSEIKQSMGDVEGACRTLVQIQVETFSSMDVREMVEYILRQMRLCIDCRDYTRAVIIAKKVNLKLIPDQTDLKLKYFDLMVTIEIHCENYLRVAEYYLNILDIVIDSDWKPIVANAVNYAVLAPYDSAQLSMLVRISKIKKLESLPDYKRIVDVFIETEIIDSGQFFADYRDLLCRSPMSEGVFGPSTAESRSRLSHLQTRIIEHNMSVIAKCYSRITIARTASLLQLSEQETENHLTKLVMDGTTWARIDRMNSIVNFRPVENYEETLNRLSSIMVNVMRTVAGAVHQIDRDV